MLLHIDQLLLGLEKQGFAAPAGFAAIKAERIAVVYVQELLHIHHLVTLAELYIYLVSLNKSHLQAADYNHHQLIILHAAMVVFQRVALLPSLFYQMSNNDRSAASRATFKYIPFLTFAAQVIYIVSHTIRGYGTSKIVSLRCTVIHDPSAYFIDKRLDGCHIQVGVVEMPNHLSGLGDCLYKANCLLL